MADKLIASVLFCLPNTIYDLPAFDLCLDDLIVGAYQADPNNKSSAGKSYVVFGKQDNTAINLSAIAAAVLSCLPNTTYDLPAFDLLLESA
jgi:hypothetical protein